MSVYKAVRITGSTANFKVIVETLQSELRNDEEMVDFLKIFVGKYLIYHPEAGERIDGLITGEQFDKWFKWLEPEVADTFVPVEWVGGL